MRPRVAWAAVTLGLALAGCARPPPEAYTPDTGRQDVAAALDIGSNTAREACTLQPDRPVARIYCGPYRQPAGRVLVSSQTVDPAGFVTASAWRTTFEHRFQCGEPRQTTLLGAPAVSLACTRRQGGWPQIVVAARVDGKLYVADTVRPAETVISRAVDALARPGSATPATVTAAASGLATERAAAEAIDAQGAVAIAEVDRQMARGAKENRLGNYVAAEAAYRAATTLQERAVGANNPALAVPLARLALQISNQGRQSETEPLFTRAARLAATPDQLDPLAAPQVAYLRALDQINRAQSGKALVLLDQAQTGFAASVPPEALVARGTVARSSVERLADGAADAALLQDPTSTDALYGLIETQRYRNVALVALGRTQEAEAALAAEHTLYSGRDQRLVARFYRTVGMTAAAAGHGTAAVSDLGLAVDSFATAQPASLPLARTQLLRANRLVSDGDDTAALALCRAAAAELQSLKKGEEAALIVPCLHAYAAEAARRPEAAQAVLAEMFGVSQLAQSSLTSRQIATATARLAAGARDARVGEAIRHGETTTDRLDELYRKRNALSADPETTKQTGTGALTALDDQIRLARAAQADAGEALQAAAPGFAALVQESVSARETQALLGPREILVSVVMDADEGWVFLLRGDRIAVGKLAGGAQHIDPLVARIRTTVAPGPDNHPPPFEIAAAREVYDTVLGPVAADFGNADSLTVAPSGSLLSLPFGVLLTGPASADAYAKAPFLIRRMAIAHVPSAASFVNLRRAAKIAQAERPWFGMGEFQPPTLPQALARFPVETCGDSARLLAGLELLPGAPKELETARRLLGAGAGDEMLGAGFTAQNVLAAPLKQYRVLHFATHAVLPTDLKCLTDPAVITSTPAGAKDANGALLTASLIAATMDLNAELVILSACNTGGADQPGAGESLSGLARSFIFAGARSLLVTHWEASDAVTPYLTALFLTRLQRNPELGPAQALAAAQRRILDQATGDLAVSGHPYYWGVFALIGGRAATAAKVAAAAPSPFGG